MTPKEIVRHTKITVEVTPRLKYYEGRQKRLGKDLPRYEVTALNNLKIEHDTIKRKSDRVAEMLKTPDNDYTKDLRWRKATNYAAMGRDWEAFWGYMGLVTDYPKVDKDRRESYMYATFVQAEKIKKRDAAREIAARYLDNPEFQKYAYEVGLRLAAIYKDEAEKDLKLSKLQKRLQKQKLSCVKVTPVLMRCGQSAQCFLKKSQWINWPTMWSL